MAVSTWLSLRDGVSAVRTADGGAAVEGHGVRLSFRPDVPEIIEALMGLVPPGCDGDRIGDALLEAGGPGPLARWYHALERLGRRGLLCRSVRSSEGPLATLAPVSTSPARGDSRDPVSPARRYQLSRFAFLRRVGDVMVLEAPTAHARVILHDPIASALVARLSVPSSIDELTGRMPGMDAEVAPLVLGLVMDAGMLEPVGGCGDGPDGGAKPTPPLDAWEFHDLLFHARSRRGRTDAPFGGTYRMAGRMECPPAVRPIPAGVSRPLFRPDLARLMEEDPPLSRVVEARRSARIYGHPPIDARQLGEWLYRVAQVREERGLPVETPAGAIEIPTAARPYPSGGALYELEFYAAVAACGDIEAGLHYYEPKGHALIPLCGLTAEAEGLLRDAAESAGIPRASLQVLVLISARLPRISWKYASMAYALVLKHVGVVYHAMYLAATAMGLAPCALGAGDSDLFARAVGTDYYAETSVGEFLLGSRPADLRKDREGEIKVGSNPISLDLRPDPIRTIRHGMEGP